MTQGRLALSYQKSILVWQYLSWENVSYAICEQQRRRSAWASTQSDQRLCCSLLRQNDSSSLCFRNFKILAGLCSWASQFVSCLVGDSRRHIFSWRGSFKREYMNCHRGSVCQSHCGSQLIFNRAGKVEATDSSHYTTKLGTTTLYFKKK